MAIYEDGDAVIFLTDEIEILVENAKTSSQGIAASNNEINKKERKGLASWHKINLVIIVLTLVKV